MLTYDAVGTLPDSVYLLILRHGVQNRKARSPVGIHAIRVNLHHLVVQESNLTLESLILSSNRVPQLVPVVTSFRMLLIGALTLHWITEYSKQGTEALKPSIKLCAYHTILDVCYSK